MGHGILNFPATTILLFKIKYRSFHVTNEYYAWYSQSVPATSANTQYFFNMSNENTRIRGKFRNRSNDEIFCKISYNSVQLLVANLANAANTALHMFKAKDKGLFILYLRKIFRKTNISYPLVRTRTCAYQGVRNVSFENILRTC